MQEQLLWFIINDYSKYSLQIYKLGASFETVVQLKLFERDTPATFQANTC